ncbi:hypothetical protein HBI04_140590 [Parastagonospora nodorum]|nr:hypothetical protein HBH49_104030 [Parastagonospora nodorum]KAH4113919.1 hypothetical protein HBH47_201810 [Parastagonospora nodorum]KAH4272912.1 hypothetical protein HBI04_140590 [Parastagonospora nodorum]KAH4932031.1 hypothetical protein HBI79_105510 [Parastagonospora nodorum]KAH5076426.1 hypothetical protein HBH95_121970 [Parastagonospora nodorum]
MSAQTRSLHTYNEIIHLLKIRLYQCFALGASQRSGRKVRASEPQMVVSKCTVWVRLWEVDQELPWPGFLIISSIATESVVAVVSDPAINTSTAELINRRLYGVKKNSLFCRGRAELRCKREGRIDGYDAEDWELNQLPGSCDCLVECIEDGRAECVIFGVGKEVEGFAEREFTDDVDCPFGRAADILSQSLLTLENKTFSSARVDDLEKKGLSILLRSR